MNKFLKIIKKRLDNYKNSNGNCPKLNEVIFELDELVNIAETQNGWISVDDRLPQSFINVLVFNKNGKVGIGFVDNTGWWSYNEKGGFYPHQANSDFFESDLMGVEYWQPLPQAPKE